MPEEFSQANGVKYFAGGDTLLSRSIPLHHEIYQRKTKIKDNAAEICGRQRKLVLTWS